MIVSVLLLALVSRLGVRPGLPRESRESQALRLIVADSPLR